MPKQAVGKLLKKKKAPSAGKLAEKAESGKKLSIKDKKLPKKAGAKGKKGKAVKKVEPEKKKKVVKKSKHVCPHGIPQHLSCMCCARVGNSTPVIVKFAPKDAALMAVLFLIIQDCFENSVFKFIMSISNYFKIRSKIAKFSSHSEILRH